MSNQQTSARGISRREFLRLGGGLALAAVGTGLVAGRARALLTPAYIAPADNVRLYRGMVTDVPPDVHLLGTDGWAYIPPTTPVPPYFPDPWAPSPFNMYVFGLRDVTGLTAEQIQRQKGQTQITAPIIVADEGSEFRIQLSNNGMIMRPDLVDAHTIHWHGFRNQIPYFDGEPMGSVAVPIGRSMVYFYRPRDPGTYMYHCHFEDTEHVHMGMTGALFVRPLQNQGVGSIPPGKYVYNDGVMPGDPTSTAYDREFSIVLTEAWAEAHWNGAHIQATDWSDYRPDFWLMNGRVYPDTLAPNGEGNDPVSGDPIPPVGRPELQYQPISSLIQANAGDRVLLRLINLGFQYVSMTTPGLDMRIVGKDAVMLRGRDGTDLSYTTNTVLMGPGESIDAIFVAPSVTSQTTYLLHNRAYARLNNGGVNGYGGQMTEIRVFPAGTLPPQARPNT